MHLIFWLQNRIWGSKGKIWEQKRRVWVTESNIRRDTKRRANISKEVKQKKVEGTESQSKSKRERQARLELEEVERKRGELSIEKISWKKKILKKKEKEKWYMKRKD